MKHPNKKIEAIRKEYAWALMVRKRHLANSCFNFWLDGKTKPTQPLSFGALSKAIEDMSLNQLADQIRNDTIIKPELNNL